MKTVQRLAVTVAVLMLWAGGVAAADKCLECHTATGDKPSALFMHDVHRTKGITCAGCHGGNASAEDMEQAMDPKAGFRGVPKGDEISQRCAACHADASRMKSFGSSLLTTQFDQLKASVHGGSALDGKERIVQCITCHGAHGIVRVTNPASPVYPLNIVRTCTRCHADAALMRSYDPKLPVDQLEKYRTSVHGKRNAAGDPKVAECASCHGSHDIRSAKDATSRVNAAHVPATCGRCHSDAAYMKPYGIPTDQQEKFSRSVHGVALLQKHDHGAPACNSCHGNHGAAPPGIESISKVCGTCHALNADLFSSSPHKGIFDQQHLPECETCHGSHEILPATDAMLGVGPEAVCSRCHTAQKNPRGFAAARSMSTVMDSLRMMERRAQDLVNDAEQKGMEVSEPKFRLRDVHQAWLQSRTMVHAFNEAKFRTAADPGLVAAQAVITEAEAAIHEYTFRRVGLGISTIIITILAGSVYLFVRRLERRHQRSTVSHSHHTPS